MTLAPPCHLGRPSPDTAGGGCPTGQLALAPVRFASPRADPPGVLCRDMDLCATCYEDKTREAGETGGQITTLTV